MSISAVSRGLIDSMLAAVNRSWLWSALAGGAILLLAWKISAPPSEFLFSDFFKAYYSSGERLLQAAGPVATFPLDVPCTAGATNIPILAWLFVPFALLSKPVAGWTFFALGIAAVAAAWVLLRRLCRSDAPCGAFLLFMFLANGPLIYSFREGNATHFVLLLVIAALLLWRAGSDYAAGLVLGAAAVIKLPLLLFGAYFVLRRRWRIVFGGATVIGLVAVLSLAVFGRSLNALWYDHCVAPFLGRTMTGFNVQSIDSFLFRLVHGDLFLLVWYPLEPTPAESAVKAIVVMALLAGALWLMIRAERKEPMPAEAGALSGRDLLDYGLVLTLAVVASPLSWSHYYLLLLLPWGLYLGGRLPLRNDSTTRRLMAGGIVLASLPVWMPPESLGELGPLISRTAVSACFVGGALTLAALARGSWQMTLAQTSDIGNLAVAAARQPTISPLDWWSSVLDSLKRLARSSMPGATVTRRLAMFFVLNSIVLNACLWVASPGDLESTTLEQTGSFLIGRSGYDSWGPMSYALDYFEKLYMPPISATPIYTQVVFDDHAKFQYPPAALFITAGLRAADELFRAYFSTNAVSWIFVVLTALSTVVLIEKRLKLSDPAFRDDWTAGLRAAVVIGISLTFYPVVKSFALGQIQTWINGLFALALLCWATERRALSGLMIGVIALIKPHYGLVLAWGALRSEWRFVVGGAVVIAFGLACSIYVFGWANHVDYLRFVGYLSQHGESYFPNHSVNGLLNRLMSLSDPAHYNNLTWSATFPPFNPWVYGGTLVFSLLILGVAFANRRGADDADGVLDFCTIALACTVASPIAWVHHYGILLPIYAVLFARFVHAPRRLIWLAVSFVFASNYFAVAQMVAGTPFNPLQSYLLFAALAVLALLVWGPSATRENALGMPPRVPQAAAG